VQGVRTKVQKFNDLVLRSSSCHQVPLVGFCAVSPSILELM
jgi:hypothetical protein